MKILPILLLTACLLLPCAGCKTSGPPPTAEAKVFDTYVNVYNAAREAFKGAQKLDLEGKLKPGRIAKINDGWNAFRTAHRIAFIQANRSVTAVPPANVIALRDSLLKLIAESL